MAEKGYLWEVFTDNRGAMTINKVTIRGNAGADPVIKYVDPTTPMARFTVATESEKHITPGGRIKAEKVTEWHTVYCYYRLAEEADAFVFKGTEVEVEGRLSYTTIYREGKTPHKVAYIVADKLTVLERRAKETAVPEEEHPNNPYGAYLELLDKSRDKDMPF